MPVWLVFVVLALDIVVVAALSASRSGARIGAALGALALPLPAFVAAPPFARALFGVAFFLVAVRALDMARRVSGRNLGGRILHLVAVVDTGRPVAPRPASPIAPLTAMLWLSATALSVLVFQTSRGHDVPRPLLWLAAAAGLLGALEGLHSLSGWLGRVFGAAVPPLSLQPYRSATLAEFWGTRWNPVISGILREHCFKPLARHPRAALAAAFAGSALLHSYLTLVSLDATMALTAGLFFVAQAPMVFVERRLAVRRWPRAAGTLWTIGVLLLLWPLLAEPIVRLFGA